MVFCLSTSANVKTLAFVGVGRLGNAPARIGLSVVGSVTGARRQSTEPHRRADEVQLGQAIEQHCIQVGTEGH
jgi:lactate dehydrogenase-like 2-hydroxyacid dehydrogenase